MARKGQTGPGKHEHSGTLKIHFFCLLLSATYTHAEEIGYLSSNCMLHRSEEHSYFPGCDPDGADATG